MRSQACDRVDVIDIRFEPQSFESACDIALAGGFISYRRKVLRRDANQGSKSPSQFRPESLENKV
jgi:hypothetical protein